MGHVPGVTLTKWRTRWDERLAARLDVVEVTEADQRRVLVDDAVDLCFVRLPIDREGLHAIPLYDEVTVAWAVPSARAILAAILPEPGSGCAVGTTCLDILADGYTTEGGQIVSATLMRRWDYCIDGDALRYRDVSAREPREHEGDPSRGPQRRAGEERRTDERLARGPVGRGREQEPRDDGGGVAEHHLVGVPPERVEVRVGPRAEPPVVAERLVGGVPDGPVLVGRDRP